MSQIGRLLVVIPLIKERMLFFSSEYNQPCYLKSIYARSPVACFRVHTAEVKIFSRNPRNLLNVTETMWIKYLITLINVLWKQKKGITLCVYDCKLQILPLRQAFLLCSSYLFYIYLLCQIWKALLYNFKLSSYF